MKADLVINEIKTIYTPYLKPPLKGSQMNDIREINNGFIAVKNGKILALGEGDGKEFINENTIVKSEKNKIVLPGFIDSHTHLVHAGSREDEYDDLKRGVPYLDILARGGGILGTVSKTRKANFEKLYLKAFASLNIMLSYGVTVVESKSGYGLDHQTEKKQLLVNKKLNNFHPVEVLSTYMGAHAIPIEYLNDKEAYLKFLVEELKKFKEENLFERVDVFCEESVFSLEETKFLLSEAKKLGYDIKMHADEIVSLGGAGLGVSLGCSSVDHLMAISDEDINKLSSSKTVANILPGTSFYLKKNYAPARKMIDCGVAVSLAGDYNPGSNPSENFQLVMQLASNYLMLTPAEVLTAVTINPAYHLNIANDKGSLEVGKDADFIVMNAENLAYILYHYGINHVKDVYIKGNQVVKNGKVKEDNNGFN